MRRALGALLLAALIWPAGALAAPTATITGSFADSCRDFTARSSKDISHVVIHYADGRVVQDESTTTPDYSIDGGAETASVLVKSGRTEETFSCTTNSPPTAVLEVKTPSTCVPFSGILYCQPDEPRTIWTRPENGNIQWPYAEPERQFAANHSFRGTSSNDPEDDIASWSLDFGDGTSTGGSWTTDPPTEFTHGYSTSYLGGAATVTLTITDSAGRSDSDTLTVHFIDARPD